MMHDDPLIGEKFGQYELLKLIGKGGMATVYLAQQLNINRQVAVKVLPKLLMHDSKFMSRFQREAEVVASLEHFHILPIYDYGEHDSQPYIVMRYLDGGSVGDYLEEGLLDWQMVIKIASQIGTALDYAHRQGIIHRDIKPSNILLDQDGNGYLADFGIAKITEGSTNLTGSGMIGTPAYMSPEQSSGSTEPSPAMDIYALGAAVFEMIAGRVPYQADTAISQILMHIQEPVPSLTIFNPNVSDGVDAVIGRAMAKSPSSRYQRAGEFAEALEKAASASGGWAWSGDTLAVRAEADTAQYDILDDYSSTTEDVPQSMIGSGVDRTLASIPARKKQRGGIGLGKIIVGLLLVIIVVGGVLGYIIISSFGENTASSEPTEIAVIAPTEKPTTVPTDTPTETAVPVTAVLVAASATPEPPTEVPTLVPSPTPLAASTFLRGVQMVLIPAGNFMMGKNDGSPNQRPVHALTLDAYYIDITEVTNQDYKACADSVEQGSCDERGLNEYASASRFKYYDVETYEKYPVMLVTWYQADTYCRWRGGQLPTEAQWEKAAGWDEAQQEMRLFPWAVPSLDVFYLNYNNSFGDTTVTKDYPGGVSPYGLYDMAGNVGEWVNDWYQDNYYEQSPPENPMGPDDGSFKVFRGGSYESSGSHLTATSRQFISPANRDEAIGFRCAWSGVSDTP